MPAHDDSLQKQQHSVMVAQSTNYTNLVVLGGQAANASALSGLGAASMQDEFGIEARETTCDGALRMTETGVFLDSHSISWQDETQKGSLDVTGESSEAGIATPSRLRQFPHAPTQSPVYRTCICKCGQHNVCFWWRNSARSPKAAVSQFGVGILQVWGGWAGLSDCLCFRRAAAASSTNWHKCSSRQ